MSFYFFILAYYNYFVTSTEAVACSKSLPIQMPGSLLRWMESSKSQRTNGPLGPLPLTGMVTNLVVGQEFCKLWEQKKPMWGNTVWQYFTEYREYEQSSEVASEENDKQDIYNTRQFIKQSEGRQISIGNLTTDYCFTHFILKYLYSALKEYASHMRSNSREIVLQYSTTVALFWKQGARFKGNGLFLTASLSLILVSRNTFVRTCIL